MVSSAVGKPFSKQSSQTIAAGLYLVAIIAAVTFLCVDRANDLRYRALMLLIPDRRIKNVLLHNRN
jgi:hypothetical protein